MRKDLNPGGVLLWDIGYFSHSVLPEYHSSLVELMARIPNIKITSDDSDRLDGIDVDGILKPIDEAWNKHIVDKDNPHKETAKVLNILLKHEIDGMLSKKLKQNLVPISWYGYDPVTFSELETKDLFTLGNGSITLKENSALMVGALYQLSSKTYTIPLNTSLDIYVKLTPAGAEFKSGKEVFNIAETNPQMYICTVTNKSGSLSTNYSPIVRVGINRFSFIPKGSAFPIGLGGPNNTAEGIHLDWKPYKVGISLLRWDTGANGFTSSTQDGNLLLVADAGLNPNLYFDVIGEIVNVTSKVETIAGSGGNITKVNNSNFRVGLGGYGNFKVTFRATIHNGKWEEVSVYFLFRNKISLSLQSTTFDSAGGNSFTGRANTTYYMHLSVGGDGTNVTHSLSVSKGGAPSVVKESNNRYRIHTSNSDSVFSISFSAVDNYGRRVSTASFGINSRLATAPNMQWFEIRRRSLYPNGHLYLSGTIPPTTVNYLTAGGKWVHSAGDPNHWDNLLIRVAKEAAHRVVFSYAALDGRGNVLERPGTVPTTYNDPRFSGPMAQSGFDILRLNNREKYDRRGQIRWDVINEVGDSRRYVYTFKISRQNRVQTGSCFTGDTLITMSDHRMKRIDEISPGDMVWTPFGPKPVVSLFKTKLGGRKLVSLNGKAKTSPEHSLWGKDPNTMDEFWTTRDMAGWVLEARTGYGPQMGNILPLDAEGNDDWLYATIDGWTKGKTVEVDMELVDNCQELPLYDVILEEGGIYCADGFLVSSLHSLNCPIDWSTFRWNGQDNVSYTLVEHTSSEPVLNMPDKLPEKYSGLIYDAELIEALQKSVLEGHKNGDYK